MDFRTEGFNGYAVEFSPFFENRLACASGSNFGIVGNGRLWVLLMDPAAPGGMRVHRIFDTQDGLFDCAWSEVHEQHIVTSSGDGSIKLWDVTLPDFPIKNWAEHTREVFCVNWNLVRKDRFISTSWDHKIKWSPEMNQSLQTFQEHTHCIYNATWSPYSPDIFASASGDQTVKLWDTRSPCSIQTLHAHTNEILSLDWNKYRENTIATASVDRSIKIWDLRQPHREMMQLNGHQYAVRKVKYSPHSEHVLASASYDMTLRVWDVAKPTPDKVALVHDKHTEFVLGVDFSLFQPGLIASCAWDEHVHLMNI